MPDLNLTRILGPLVLSLLILSGCTTNPPRDVDNVCAIFKEKSGWYDDTRRAYKHHGIPIHVQMAIMRQESNFRAKAKPPRRWIFGIIPWTRPSSAYGYAQVKQETWDWYMDKRGFWFADRDDFGDAVEFIGWYGKLSHDTLGISKWDAYKQYLAYHEGQGGFKRKTYLKKKWLVKVARKVKGQASRYHTQLARCEKSLQSPWWWPF
ncbi:MAG: hypothetical protein OEX12_01900 [Gammaproteobacteria bacterium]|nr:hypothetical protein [Gammaproteobacteria bacterium]